MVIHNAQTALEFFIGLVVHGFIKRHAAESLEQHGFDIRLEGGLKESNPLIDKRSLVVVLSVQSKRRVQTSDVAENSRGLEDRALFELS